MYAIRSYYDYDLAIIREEDEYYAITRLCIGNIKMVKEKHRLSLENKVRFLVDSDSQQYRFFLQENERNNFV